MRMFGWCGAWADAQRHPVEAPPRYAFKPAQMSLVKRFALVAPE